MTSKPDFEISFAHDGPELSPRQMGTCLAELTADGAIEADYYSNGGAVTALERAVAARLGKERAVIFPTGTLANLLALRRLGGTSGGRIVVHRDSHLFNDSGDNLSQLGGFTMVPLNDAGAGFSADAVRGEIARCAGARVASRLACIAVESPVRRQFGACFPSHDLAEIVALAKGEGIPLFYDGARLMIEAAYTGRDPAEIVAPFDLVYVSLYKYLGAPFGCVIAGGADVLDGLYHDRRRFGGGLYQSWPAAVLALDHLPGHLDRWRAAIDRSEAVIDQLMADERVTVERIDNGTNIFLLSCPAADLDKDRLDAAAEREGVKLPAPSKGKLAIKINETWTRWDVDRLASTLIRVLTAQTA